MLLAVQTLQPQSLGPGDFPQHKSDHNYKHQESQNRLEALLELWDDLPAPSAESKQHIPRPAWIPERSATRLREADLNVFSKLGNQGLEGRLEPEAFTGREVRREDDLLDFLVGYPVDIEMARQPST